MSYAPVPPPVSPVPPVTIGYAMPGTRTLLPVKDRARVAVVCFQVLLAMSIVMIAAGLAVTVMFPDDGDAAALDAGAESAGLALAFGVLGAALLYFVVLILTIVFYCMWQYRAHNNAATIAGGRMEFTPGWGVGYWFIPILNLFRPYQVVRAIEEATPPVPGRPPLGDLVGWWWGLMIASLILGRISAGIVRVAPEATMLSGGIDVVTSVIDIVAIVLIIRIIRSISDRQAAIAG